MVVLAELTAAAIGANAGCAATFKEGLLVTMSTTRRSLPPSGEVTSTEAGIRLRSRTTSGSFGLTVPNPTAVSTGAAAVLLEPAVTVKVRLRMS